MSEIKRYSLIDCVVGKGYMATITEDPGGAWVKYADHAAEVERLRFKHLPECNYQRNECGVGGCICTVVNKNEVERIKSENVELLNQWRKTNRECMDEIHAKDAEIAALKDDIGCYEAMKDGVSVRISDLEDKIAALTAALDEATMLLHEFQTDCGWDTTLERDFANIKTPASRALCEKLFGGTK